ncbi:MAG: hypothetical protein KC613_02075, partial [Myxococcales bacterium]|nr:hypothetical protein [Myxococcales bacterium]
RWSARAGDVAPFGRLVGQPLRGRVRASGQLSGPWAAPLVAAEVRGAGLGWRDLDVGAVEADARLNLGTRALTVQRLAVQGPLGEVAGDGALELAGRQKLKARLTVRGVDLGRLPLGGLPVGGRLDGQVTAGGRLAAPTVEAKVRVVKPRYDRLTLHRLDLDGAWDGREVRLRDLSLADDEGKRLTAEGRFAPRSGRFDGRLGLLALDLSLVNRFLPAPIPLRGRVTATLGGAGTLSDPQGEGRVVLEGIGYDTLELGEGALSLSAGGQMVMLRGPVFDAFEIDAAVPTAPGPTGRLTVAMDGLAVERFVPAMKAADARARVTGAISAFLTEDWQLDRVRAQLSEVAAGLTLRDSAGRVVRAPEAAACDDEADPACASVALVSQKPVDLLYTHANQTVQVKQLALGGGGQSFQVTGEATVDRLALQVIGGLDLAGLFPFLRSAFTEVEGRAELALAVTGAPANPDFSGRVRLDQAELIPRSPTVGSDLSLLAPVTLTIEPPIGPVMPGPDGRLPRGRFVVDLPPQVDGRPNDFRLRRDDGEVEINLLSGDFEDFQPQALRVGLATEEAELDVPRTLNAALRTQDATFEMWVDPNGPRGPKNRLRLAGHIDILRGEYTADIAPAAQITRGVSDNFRGRNRVRTVSVFERSELMRNLEVDLSLRGQDEIFVRNKVTVLDLDLAVALDLRHVRGSLYPKGETPLSIEGTVDVLDDSRITYARRPFDVTVGDVVFGAGSFVTADVVATHTFRLRTDRATQAGTFDRGASGDVREEEVTLTVRVGLDQLGADPEIDLNLASSSGASKIEVATLVLTGAYPSDLTGAAGAAPATEVLLSPVLSLIEAPFEETLDVDLTLTPATTGTLFIDADKILSRRLRLYSRTPVGDEAANNLQTFGLEYRLNNEVTGELTNEQLGNLNSTSGRLRFRLLLD